MVLDPDAYRVIPRGKSEARFCYGMYLGPPESKDGDGPAPERAALLSLDETGALVGDEREPVDVLNAYGLPLVKGMLVMLTPNPWRDRDPGEPPWMIVSAEA